MQLPERYRVIGELGSGAMSVVYEADDLTLGRRVALKVLRPDTDAEAQYRARMFREARALAQIEHPNVVAISDVGECGDAVYLALDLVRGTDAAKWRAAETRTPAQVLDVWCQVAAGLAAVHAAGVIHRDLKPENVLVGTDGRAVITDFGLATGLVGDVPLTGDGYIVGTPLYMAVEILHGHPATALSDQFAWCVCVWEALFGSRPFATRSSIAAQAFAMMNPPAVPPDADREVVSALVRGLDPVPAKRWPDIAAAAAALQKRPWWARLLRR